MRSEAACRAAALAVLLVLGGCYDGDPSDFRESVVVGREEVTALALDVPATLVETGTTLRLAALATTARGVQNLSADATWRSSNAAVLVVDDRGRVTAVADGTATISAELGLFRDSVAITASSAQLLSIAVGGSAAVDECDSATYTASGTYEDATVRDITGLVSWSASDPDVAHMSTLAADANRLVTRNAGTVAVTATRGAIVSPGFPVTVADTLTAIDVTPDAPAALDPDDTRQFTATATWGARTADVSRATAWSVVNVDAGADTVASVRNGDASPGLLTALAGGEAVLTGACGGLQDTVDIEVVSLQSLTITNTRPIELAPGGTLLLSLEGTYTSGTTKPLNEQATWSAVTVSGTGVTVSNTAGSRGRVTAGDAEGVAEVTAEVDGREVTVSVTVTR